MRTPPQPDIVFLDFEDICEIHARAIREFDGGMDGFLAETVVRSAAVQPQAGIQGMYFYSYPAGMAAAYLYFLTNQQGFLNGNKRTAVGAALEFLACNGFALKATAYEVYQATVQIAGEDVDRDPKDVLADLERWISSILIPL